MLTAAQRSEIIGLAADADPDGPPASDEDIWYGFLSSLYAAGKTLKDLRLTRVQQPEIMACLRRAPSVPPRKFGTRGERPVGASPPTAPRPR
jgi:hypothetical protein